MITAMVMDQLSKAAGVTALVSTRIYADELPKPTTSGSTLTLPALVVLPASEVPSKEVGKGSQVRIQVSCWSNPPVSNGRRSPAEVESVAAAVKAVLHVARANNTVRRWTIGSVSYDITSSYVTGGTRMIDPGTNWYHKPIDVQISYREV